MGNSLKPSKKFSVSFIFVLYMMFGPHYSGLCKASPDNYNKKSSISTNRFSIETSMRNKCWNKLISLEDSMPPSPRRLQKILDVK